MIDPDERYSSNSICCRTDEDLMDEEGLDGMKHGKLQQRLVHTQNHTIMA